MSLEFIVRIIVLLSGAMFGIIASHRLLYVLGVFPYEFKRVDRIKTLFKISFIIHMISVIAFIIIIST